MAKNIRHGMESLLFSTVTFHVGLHCPKSHSLCFHIYGFSCTACALHLHLAFSVCNAALGLGLSL